MDYSKLNVSQLKALCKEKGLSGYSKLTRQALIDKLSAKTSSIEGRSSNSTVNNSDNPSSSSSSSVEPQTRAQAFSSSHLVDHPSINNFGISPDLSLSRAPLGDKDTCTPALNTFTTDAADIRTNAATTSTASPDTVTASEQPVILSKDKFKMPPVPFTVTSCVSPDRYTNTTSGKKRSYDAALSANSVSASASNSSSSLYSVAQLAAFSPVTAATQSVGRPGKRFKPLTICRATPKESRSSQATQSQPTAETIIQTQNALFHLDFPAPFDLPVLDTITLPPSISQRKFVHRWAILLSGLANAERRALCTRVSRMFRYAVYLSASEILAREYAGARLEQARTLYSAPTFNWWPYLRAREREKSERLRSYESSFLAMFYGACPVADRLLASPDSSKQLSVVFRFLQSRLWFALSIGTLSGAGSDPLVWLRPTILDAQEVVPGEIWHLRTSALDLFNILEATGEVVGHPPGSSSVMRADWTDYAATQGEGKSLLQTMRWSHQGEFERGISRHWRARMEEKSDEGKALLAVAERYTLANVVTNGVSGIWMSVTEMAQELSDPVQPIQTTKKSTKQSLGLFLPAHHHVESVHFNASKGGALHSALAVVQTPGREYFILRDTGMQVGCEEDGVANIWQKVLGCDINGRVVEDEERITLASLSR